MDNVNNNDIEFGTAQSDTPLLDALVLQYKDEIPEAKKTNPSQDAANAIDIGDLSPDGSSNRNINVPCEDSNTAFERALRTPGCAKDVKECLKRGSNANYINLDKNKAAINYAVDSCDPKIITTLLRHSVVKVNHEYENLTPLYSLVKNIKPDNFSDVAECMRLLLQYGALPDRCFRRTNTPLCHMLCNSILNEEQKREILRLLLEFDADVDMGLYPASVDKHRNPDYSAYEYIKRFYPDLIISVVKLKEPGDINKDGDGLEEILQNAFDFRDLNLFRRALNMGIDPMRPCIYQTTIGGIYKLIPFEKVLYDAFPEFLEECLRRGCKADYINRELDKAAINFAATSCDPRIFEILLRYPGVQVNHLYNQMAPLHSLVKNHREHNAIEVTACMKLLLDNNATPNVIGKHQWTPLHYVLIQSEINAESKREIVQLLLEPKYDVDVDTYCDGQLRSILEHDYPDLTLPEAPPEIYFETLVECLRSGDERKFLHKFFWYRVNSTADQNIELLREAINFGRNEVVAMLTEIKFDSDFLKSLKQSPTNNAIITGNWVALEKLLKYGFPINSPTYALSCIISEVLFPIKEPTEICDFRKCFQVMLDLKEIDVRKIDKSLIIEALFNPVLMKEIIEHGGYLGEFVYSWPAKLLEEHLDNCITKRSYSNKRPWICHIHMNFKNFLVRDQLRQDCGDNDMSLIRIIANTEEFRHLLTHPLIGSFLYLKWHRFAFFFYANFIFYLLFAASSITHTAQKFNGNEHVAFIVLSWTGIFYLIVREVAQFAISPTKKEYICSPSNWLELALIGLSISNCAGYSFSDDNRRGIAAFTIILIAIELCLLVASLPFLFISTLMVMLRAVLFTFVKFISFFLIFIFAFSFCFQILFSKPDINRSTPDSIAPESEFNKFPNFFTSFVKTMVMFTGEFDAGSIDFNSWFAKVVFLFFAFFMTIVVINLLNGLAISDIQIIRAQAELNGFIWRVNLLHRFEYQLNHYEEFLTVKRGNSPLNNVLRYISKKILNRCPNHTAHGEIFITVIEDLENQIILDINKFNWFNYSRDKEEVQNVYLGQNVKYFPKWYTSRYYAMDSQIVKLAKNIIKQKELARKQNERQRRNENKQKNEREKKERRLKDIQKQIKYIQNKLKKSNCRRQRT